MWQQTDHGPCGAHPSLGSRHQAGLHSASQHLCGVKGQWRWVRAVLKAALAPGSPEPAGIDVRLSQGHLSPTDQDPAVGQYIH